MLLIDGKEECLVKSVKSNSEEWKNVELHFKASMLSAKIEKIERI
jgi:hypothetical protein